MATDASAISEESIARRLAHLVQVSAAESEPSKRVIAYDGAVHEQEEHAGRFVKRLNAHRQAKHKKGTIDDTAQHDAVIDVAPALFPPERFHFNKVDPREVLHARIALPPPSPPSPAQPQQDHGDGLPQHQDGAPASRLYTLLVNKYPLGPCHTILASSERRPQVLTLPDLDAARHFVEHAVPSLALFYNSWSAGASVNHFHFQTFPAALLPFTAHASGAGDGGAGDGDDRDPWPAAFQLFALEDVRGAHEAVQRCLQQNKPHNLLIARAFGIALFTRTADTARLREARRVYQDYPAGLECAGVFTPATRSLFQELDEQRIAWLLASTTVAPDEREQ